jgi:hypothetical protein
MFVSSVFSATGVLADSAAVFSVAVFSACADASADEAELIVWSSKVLFILYGLACYFYGIPAVKKIDFPHFYGSAKVGKN